MIREHLQAIYDAHGTLTPAIVVREARPKNHPLHSYVFDRAPAEAAEAWYRHRAHELIQRVKITYAAGDGEERSVRAFICTRTENGYAYDPAEKVAVDPFLRELALRDMEREWKLLHARYGHFEEFIHLVAADVGTQAA